MGSGKLYKSIETVGGGEIVVIFKIDYDLKRLIRIKEKMKVKSEITTCEDGGGVLIIESHSLYNDRFVLTITEKNGNMIRRSVIAKEMVRAIENATNWET